MNIRNTNTLLVVLIFYVFVLSILSLGTYLRVENGERLAATTEKYQQVGSKNKQILILGDSLAYGVGSSEPKQSFAGQLGQIFPDATITNKSVVGSDIADLLVSYSEKNANKYDATFIIIGGNDIVRPSVDLDKSISRLDKIYRLLSSKSNQSFVITTSSFDNVTLFPVNPLNYYTNRSKKLRDGAKELSEKYENVQYIDFFDYNREEYKLLQADDGFHLNDNGIKELINKIPLERVQF